MKCDRLGPVERTSRELLANSDGEGDVEAHVLKGPAALLACPAPGPLYGVGEALLRRLLDRCRIDQNALALIAFTSCTPADHDGRQPTGLRGAPGERGIAGGQKLEMAEVRAGQAQRPRLVHEKKLAAASTRSALKRIVWRDHSDPLTARSAARTQIRHCRPSFALQAERGAQPHRAHASERSVVGEKTVEQLDQSPRRVRSSTACR